MHKGLTFAAGLGIGTGLMFLLDPDRGKRRRALLRDKMVWASRKMAEGCQGTTLDLRNRAQGVIHEVRSHFSSAPVDDATLIERVRSKLGRVVSHPGAIHVTVQNGIVTFSGSILAGETTKLLKTVKRIPGVKEVATYLETHVEPKGQPALQGGREGLAY